MKVDLFTQTYTVEMSIEDGHVLFKLDDDDKELLQEYLMLVLPNYVQLPEGDLTFIELVEIANQWQEENPEMKLVEPMTKLPYDVDLEVKTMLEELSNVTGTSQAKLITKIVNQAYQEKVRGKA